MGRFKNKKERAERQGYLKIPCEDETVAIFCDKEITIVKVTRGAMGEVVVETAKKGESFKVQKIIKSLDVVADLPEQNKKKSYVSLKERIIRFRRMSLSADKIQEVTDNRIKPDVHCDHINVQWKNDAITNTRHLICADCSKTLKSENGTCNHIQVMVVHQHYSPFTQMRCQHCGYTWWDKELSNKEYFDPDGADEPVPYDGYDGNDIPF